MLNKKRYLDNLIVNNKINMRQDRYQKALITVIAYAQLVTRSSNNFIVWSACQYTLNPDNNHINYKTPFGGIQSKGLRTSKPMHYSCSLKDANI